MKKDYIKPEIHLEDFELEPLMALETSKGTFEEEPGSQGGLGAKDREEVDDSEWGDLW